MVQFPLEVKASYAALIISRAFVDALIISIVQQLLTFATINRAGRSSDRRIKPILKPSAKIRPDVNKLPPLRLHHFSM